MRLDQALFPSLQPFGDMAMALLPDELSSPGVFRCWHVL